MIFLIPNFSPAMVYKMEKFDIQTDIISQDEFVELAQEITEHTSSNEKVHEWINKISNMDLPFERNRISARENDVLIMPLYQGINPDNGYSHPEAKITFYKMTIVKPSYE